ncbi:MAG: hypothetical protein M0T84_05720 [Betaproteobacteria bacterium]|nr:hypothetical protein [Betaproteobacteria bacterium]
MDEFEKQLKGCHFFQQVLAELQHKQGVLLQAAEQTIAMVATAAARQMNAEILAQNLERMEGLFSHQVPNEVRSEMIRLAISMVRNSGTAAGHAH